MVLFIAATELLGEPRRSKRDPEVKTPARSDGAAAAQHGRARRLNTFKLRFAPWLGWGGAGP